MPTKYVCEELSDKFVNYWTEVQDGNKGLEKLQLNALIRWNAFRHKYGKSTKDNPLPLHFFLDIFDDYFFLGSLCSYTEVKWAEETPQNSRWVGHTARKRQRRSSGPPEVLIQIKQQPDELWTRALIKQSFDILLHEMTHAFLMIYSPPGRFMSRLRYRRIAEMEGLTGHGPCWVKVAAAVAKEADRSLGGGWGEWELLMEDALIVERKGLQRYHDTKGLRMMLEKSD